MKQKKQTLLWRLAGEGIVVPSYLFGTMHVQDRRAFEGIEAVLGKIDACQAFAAEFHLDEAIGETNAASMLLPVGLTLHDFIPPKKYGKLRQRLLKSLHLDLDHFQRNLPFLVVNVIGTNLLQTDRPVSLDEYLWNYAAQSGKKRLGIETYQEQMEILRQIPLEMQVKMLLVLGSNLRRYRLHLQHLADLYCGNDLQGLFKTVKKNARGLRKIMLWKRNEIMADRIALLAKQESLFAAVGAGHLAGGKGVLRLLKKKGIMVLPEDVKQ